RASFQLPADISWRASWYRRSAVQPAVGSTSFLVAPQPASTAAAAIIAARRASFAAGPLQGETLPFGGQQAGESLRGVGACLVPRARGKSRFRRVTKASLVLALLVNYMIC